MIYFDNAATTKYKPDEVIAAFEYYVREIGVSPGRGSYQLGIVASRMLYKTRKLVANYFGLDKANVIFTKNSTEAMNLFFYGYLTKGDHVIITCYEHNSVLRPLHMLKEKGVIDYTVIPRDDLELSADTIVKKYARNNTVLFATTLASNLTGRIVFTRELAKKFSEFGIKVFVDSSQGAGKLPLSMIDDYIDYLAFTGHKDLMALPGVGGLCCKEVLKWKPLLQGGTGIIGDSYINPEVFPEGYEAGTLNMPAIWSLNASISYLLEEQDNLIKKEQELSVYLIDRLKRINGIEIYDLDKKRISTIGINLNEKKSNEVVEYLDKNDICTRGGLHCTILTHEALGTKERGVVRLSLSPFNTREEIDYVTEIIEKLGE